MVSDDILVALITSLGALILSVINILATASRGAKKKREQQHEELVSKLDKSILQQHLQNKALQAMLRYQLYELWAECKKKKFANKDNRSNFLNLYDLYHTMGKNGVMDDIKKEFLELPFDKPPSNSKSAYNKKTTNNEK